MFTFFAVLTIISLISLIISFVMMGIDKDPLTLWVTLLVISGILVGVGAVGGMACLSVEASKEYTVQVEYPKDNNSQYNYCPYCGKEIK